MPIKSSMSHVAVEGPPHEHIITLNVAYDTGGGGAGTATVNVAISWDPTQLKLTGTTSPAGGLHNPGGGVVLWGGKTVNQYGTNFVVRLRCRPKAAGFSQVWGEPVEVGHTGRQIRHVATPEC